MHAFVKLARPGSRAAVAVAVVALVAACGQASVDTDPAGATTSPSAATSSAASATSSTSASAPSSSASPSTSTGSAAAAGGATGSGTSSSVVITAPGDGERLPAGPVGIVGRGTAPEGTLLWSITQADGTVLSDGYTTAGANGEVADFAVQQQVQAGSCDPCTARVWVPDESDGEAAGTAGPASAATVTFSVG